MRIDIKLSKDSNPQQKLLQNLLKETPKNKKDALVDVLLECLNSGQNILDYLKTSGTPKAMKDDKNILDFLKTIETPKDILDCLKTMRTPKVDEGINKAILTEKLDKFSTSYALEILKKLKIEEIIKDELTPQLKKDIELMKET